ncbi:MAG: type II toxin-antitoxin system ParD family antitoxin [Rhodospirillales bacterium]
MGGTDLDEHQLRFIERQVASGHYGSAQEVVADALRLLEEREARLAGLDAAIEEGCAELDRGETVDAEAAFDELEQAYRPQHLPPRRR